MGTWNSSVWNSAGSTETGIALGVRLSDLLRSSFRCIGQLRPGFGYSPSELTDGLFVLNAMLDSWSVDDLNCPSTLSQAFPLVAGKKQYTFGPGGDFNAPRPVGVDKVTLVVMTNPSSPLRLDVRSLNADEYQDIALQDTGSLLTRQYFFNPSNVLATMNFWPVPSEADFVEISSSQAIAGGLTDETAVFSVPPGYLDAVRYHLAIRLAMEWEKPLKPGVVALATEALAKVQRRNAPTPQMQCNRGVFPSRGGGGTWNRYTGD